MASWAFGDTETSGYRSCDSLVCFVCEVLVLDPLVHACAYLRSNACGMLASAEWLARTAELPSTTQRFELPGLDRCAFDAQWLGEAMPALKWIRTSLYGARVLTKRVGRDKVGCNSRSWSV